MGRQFIALVGLVALVAGACGGSPASASPIPTASPTVVASPSPTTSLSPTASPSAVASPSPSTSSSPVAEPTDNLGPFSCSLPLTLAGTASGPTQARPTAVRVGSHAGYDRIVFEYADRTIPSVEISVVSPPFRLDPSDLPMTVAGSSFLRIKLDGVQVGYAGTTDFAAGYPELVELSRQGDYEAIQSWIVGLNKAGCVRLFVLTAPQRIVIDIQS